MTDERVNERVARYEEAIQSCVVANPEQLRDLTEAVVAVADFEQAALVAENERLREALDRRRRAFDLVDADRKAAEAQIERLRRRLAMRKVEAEDCPHLPDCFNYPDRYVGKVGDLSTHDADWPCCKVKDPHWHVREGVGIGYEAAEAALVDARADDRIWAEVVKWKEHAEAADAKLAKVEALADEWGAWTPSSISPPTGTSAAYERGIRACVESLRAALADAPAAERPDLDRLCACGHLLTDHLDGLACYAGTTVTSEFACDCGEWRPDAPAEP